MTIILLYVFVSYRNMVPSNLVEACFKQVYKGFINIIYTV